MTARITLAEFVAEHDITADVAFGAPAGAFRPEGMDPGANAWTVTLALPDGDEIVTPFYTGSALGEPTVTDVLGCLAMDAAAVENAGGSFWDWVDDYGMEATRETERAFRATVDQTDRLRTWLGPVAFDQLVWHVDND